MGGFTSTNLIILWSFNMAVSTVGGGGTITLSQPKVQAWTITTVADVAGNTSGKYFLISSQNSDFYFWNNVSNANLDPKIPGRNGVQIVYNSGASASTIANAIQTAFQLLGGIFNTNISAFDATTVQVQTSSTGAVLSPYNVGTSSWTISDVQTGTGFTSSNVGLTESFNITTVADVSGNTNNKYFLFSGATTNYYVWNNVGGAGVDPNISGRTGIAVTYSTNASALTIASAINSATSSSIGGYNVANYTGTGLPIVQFTGNTVFTPLQLPNIGNSLFTLTRIRQAVFSQKTFAGGPFSVTLFTTPNIPNYTFEIEIFVTPQSINVTNNSTPSSGIEWSLLGNNLKQISTTTDQTALTGANTRTLTGGWRTIKCGPNTPVTVSGYAYSANETYTISYVYVGYQIT